MEFEKGELLAEGKTKKIFAVHEFEKLVIIEYKNNITAFDDPSKTKTFGTKAARSNSTTCRMFEILKKAGIPVAYQEQISPTQFIATKCNMIKVEAVARRFAVGSYLKRHPELAQPEGKSPHRFHRLVTELFLKTTGGQFADSSGKVWIQGLDSKKGEEDPFIINPLEKKWQLFHPKKPNWDPEADLKITTPSCNVVIDPCCEKIETMDKILRQVFLTLEGAWNTLGLHFIDLKIEFGITPDEQIVVADVIDNDSWRLRDKDWKELSKEAFRQGEKLDEVEQKYGIVATLAEQIRIPTQALVIWTGSKNDELPKIPPNYLSEVHVILSGHKSTKRCLERLEELLAEYPDGGVIVVKVGRSNGLGPILASRTSWPIIAIPATIKEYPEDIWSSIRMPSQVPLLTAWPEENAIQAALNILAAKNPLIYAQMQEQIETLDA